MSLPLRSSFLVSAIFVAACGGKSATAPTTTAAAAGASEAPPPADMAFKDMNADQRVAFMKLSVMPAMKAAFQEFDATKFADFTCKTCHGKGAADGSFEMPNPDLPRLPTAEKFPEYAKDPKHGPMRTPGSSAARAATWSRAKRPRRLIITIITRCQAATTRHARPWDSSGRRRGGLCAGSSNES